MGNDIENLQNSVNTIVDDLQLIKNQNLKNTLSIDNVNSTLQMLNSKDNISKETLYSTQDQLGKYITSNVLAKVSEVSQNVITLKNLVENSGDGNIVELREILGGLSLKVGSVQEALKDFSGNNYSELKNALLNLGELSSTAISNLDKNMDLKIHDVKSAFSEVNETLKNFLSSELSHIKSMFDAVNLDVVENKLGLISDILVSHATSSQIEKSFADVNGQFEALKYLISSSSVNSDVTEKISGFVAEIQNAIKTYVETSNNGFDELKHAMVVFNEVLGKISAQNDEKLSETINETAAIKRDILAVKESLENYSINNVDALSEKFDNVFVELSKLEKSFSQKNSEALKQCLENTEEAFNRVLRAIDETRNLSETTAQNEHLNNLAEKTDLLKNELNLVTSDVFENMTKQTELVCQNIQEMKSEIQNKTEEIIYSAQNKLKEDIQQYINAISAETENNGNVINPEFVSDLRKIEMNIVNALGNITSENTKITSEISKVQEQLDNIRTINLSNKEDILVFLEQNFEKLNSNDAMRQSGEQLVTMLDGIRTISLANKEDILVFLEKSFETLNANVAGKDFITEKFNKLQSDIMSHLEVKSQEDINVANAISDLQKNVIEIVSERMQILAMEAASNTQEMISDFRQEEKEYQKQNNEFYLDKVNEFSERINEEFSELVKNSLDEMQQSVLTQLKTVNIQAPEVELPNISEVFEKHAEQIFAEVFSKFNNNSDEIFEKIDDIQSSLQSQINDMKSLVVDEFSIKFNEIKDFYSAQNGLLKLSSEIKNTIGSLEEKIVEANVNSTMEISKLLFSLLNEVSNLKAGEVSKGTDEIKVVPKTEAKFDSSEIQNAVFEAKEEIKKILAIQHPLIKKIDNLGQKEDLEILQNNLKEVLIVFNTKLDSIISNAQNDGMKSDLHAVIERIEKTLNEFSKEMISSVVGVFNGINFDVEKQEIKEFVKSNADEIKHVASENFAALSSQISENSNKIYEISDKIKFEIVDELSKSLLTSFDKLLTSEQYDYQTEELNNAVRNLSENVVDKLALIENLKDFIEQSNSTFTDKNAQIYNELSEFKANFVQVVKDIFQEFFDERNSALTKKFENVNNVVIKMSATAEFIAREIENLKPEFFEKLQETFREVTVSNISKMNALSSQMNSKFEELASNSFQNREEIIGKVDEMTSRMETKVEELSSNSVQNRAEILGKVDEMTSRMETKVEELSSNSVQNRAEILGKVDEMTSRVETKVEELSSNSVQNRAEILGKVDEMTSRMETKVEELSSNSVQNRTEILGKADEMTSRMETKVEELSSNSVQNRTEIIGKISDTQNKLEDLDSKIHNYLTEETSKLLSVEKSQTYFSSFEQKIDELSDNFVQKLSSVDLLNDLINDQSEHFTINLDKLREDVSDIIKTEFKEELDNASEKLKEETAKSFADMSFTNTETINSLGSLLQEKLAQTASNINTHFNKSVEASGLNAQVLKQELLAKVDEIIVQNAHSSELAAQNISEFKSEISSALDGIVPQIINLADVSTAQRMNAKTEILSKIEEILPEILKSQTSDSEKLSDMKDALISKIEESLSSLGSAISSCTKDIASSKNEIVDLQNQIYDYVMKNLPQLQSVELSEEQTNSIKNDIKDLSGELANSVASIDALSDIVKNALIEINENMESFRANLLDIIKASFQEAFEDKADDIINNINSGIDSNLTSLSSVIADKVEEIRDISQNSDLTIKDLKDLVVNKLDEISEIKKEISLLPKEKEVGLEDIDTLVTDKLKSLKSQIDLLPKSTLEIKDVKDLIEKNLDDLKINIENAAKSAFDKDAIQTIVSDKITNLKDEFTELHASSDIAVNEIYELLDGRTESIKSQIRQLSADGLKAEDIRDLLNDKLDDIKADLRLLSLDGEEHQNDLLNNFDTIRNMSSNIDTSCNSISNDLNEVKNHLTQISHAIKENESDYPYSFEDIETDILKVRMILKELTEKNALTRDEGLEKIEEDLVSISTRTNKLLLNSDETANFLQSSIEDLKNLLALFDNKVSEFDYQKMFDKLENRIDEISEVVYSNTQNNKKLTQAFTYLAEWIDKTDEKLYDIEQRVRDISYIKQNMIKKSDLESIFEKVARKMEKQQEKIKTLEEKVKVLSRKEPNIKTLVKEVLSTVPDTKLVKKVDGIDRQLATLGKSIEKITSYVD
ncbi:hypothetical protein IJ732_04315 [bacterium]|nr:hypothetical protein [bacterium]